MLELLVTSHGSSESRGAEQGTGCSWGLRAINVAATGRTGERARPRGKRAEGEGKVGKRKEGKGGGGGKAEKNEIKVTGSSVKERLRKKASDSKIEGGNERVGWKR